MGIEWPRKKVKGADEPKKVGGALTRSFRYDHECSFIERLAFRYDHECPFIA